MLNLFFIKGFLNINFIDYFFSSNLLKKEVKKKLGEKNNIIDVGSNNINNMSNPLFYKNYITFFLEKEYFKKGNNNSVNSKFLLNFSIFNILIFNKRYCQNLGFLRNIFDDTQFWKKIKNYYIKFYFLKSNIFNHFFFSSFIFNFVMPLKFQKNAFMRLNNFVFCLSKNLLKSWFSLSQNVYNYFKNYYIELYLFYYKKVNEMFWKNLLKSRLLQDLNYIHFSLSKTRLKFYVSDFKGNVLFTKTPGNFGFKHLLKRKNIVLSYVLEQCFLNFFKKSKNFLKYYVFVFDNLSNFSLFYKLKNILRILRKTYYKLIFIQFFYLKNNLNSLTYKRRKKPRI